MTTDKHRRAFISYSRTNKEFATKLTKGLRSAGFPVWFDQLDIPTGARWDDEVEKALRECSIFMIILTPASIASENVKDEIGYAIDHGKRILPVLLEDCDVPLRLRRFQYVDFTTKSFEEGFESAKDLLGDLVEEASVPVAATTPVVEAQIDQKAEREAKAEAEQLAQAKAETERKAKEEADRLAVQKAELNSKIKEEDEAKRLAQVEAERKAKEEADRLIAQKAEREAQAEAERLVLVKAETERKAKEEAEKFAAQKAESEAQAEADRKAKEMAKPVESASAATTQKKPMSKGLVIGIVAVVVLVIGGIGFGALSSRGTPATEAPATEAPVIDNLATEVLVVDNPATEVPVVASGPVVLSVDEAKALYDSTSVKGFYSFATEQYTDEQLTGFSNNNQPIPLTMTDSIPLLLGWSDCAKTQDILEDNMPNSVYTFIFMGNTIPESNHGNNDFTADTGDACRVTYIIIDGWTTGQYSVYQEVELTQKINDGYSDIDPYKQQQEYVVTVP